jgi:hypothetical protein
MRGNGEVTVPTVGVGLGRTLIIWALSSSIAQAQQAAGSSDTGARQFVGTWRLVSLEGDSLSLLARRGDHPMGYLYYDATGHMAVQIQPDRSRPSWPPTRVPSQAEALEAVTGYVAYFGTYQIDSRARSVTHHREGALNLDLIDYVRRYEFDGPDRLSLMPVDRPGIRLVWERVK